MAEQGQVSRRAAEMYDEALVPALFAQWTGPVLESAAIGPGNRVLDVACGTGVLACAVAARVLPDGNVLGLDNNAGMLAVARKKAPDITWREGCAERLPFEDEEFDAVVSQFGLMFFEDRRAALAEMWRVLRPGGRLAVAVWAGLDESPAYAAVVDLLQKEFGDAAANVYRGPFVLGDRQRLESLFTEAGIAPHRVTTHRGTARFPSIRSWITGDIKGWSLDGLVDGTGLEQLINSAEKALHEFASGNGRVAFPMPAHVVTAEKPWPLL